MGSVSAVAMEAGRDWGRIRRRGVAVVGHWCFERCFASRIGVRWRLIFAACFSFVYV